jgi:methyl-accepting chemotaxis protein
VKTDSAPAPDSDGSPALTRRIASRIARGFEGVADRFSLSSKLAIALGLLLAPLFVAAVAISNNFKERIEVNTRQLILDREIAHLTHEALTNLLIQETVVQQLLLNPDNFADAPRKIEAYDANVLVLQRLYELSQSSRMRSVIDRLIALEGAEFREADTQILESIGNDRKTAETIYATRYRPMLMEFHELARELGQLADREAEATAQLIESNNRDLVFNTYASLLTGMVFVCLAVWPMTAFVRRRLRRMVEVLCAVASGDLSRRIETTSRDEIGQMASALNTAVESMRRAFQTAEAAGKAKSEFLANMSHEIRTPLNGIIGMTEIALDTELTLSQREYLDLVKSSADALLVVINDILDFSKIEAGKLDLDPIDFNLRDALGDTLKTLGMRAQAKGLELACHITPEVPDDLTGDPGRLRQIVLNLVGNAIKFTEKG